MINAILDGSVDHTQTQQLAQLNLTISKVVSGVDSNILDPRYTYNWKLLVSAGPQT